MNQKTIKKATENLKKILKDVDFRHSLNPRYNLMGTDKYGAPSKLAKSFINDRVRVLEILVDTVRLYRDKRAINNYKKQIRYLNGKKNYRHMLQACQESKRKAIEEHRRYFSINS